MKQEERSAEAAAGQERTRSTSTSSSSGGTERASTAPPQRPPSPPTPSPAPPTRFDQALRLATAVVPAAVAAAGASSTALAAHDDGLIRTAGVGFTGAFRALDLLVAAPAMLLPFGTRALRGGLASAIVTGLCGLLAFDIARELVTVVPAAVAKLWMRDARGKSVSPRLLSAVASVAVLSALLAPAWQAEARAPGGAVTGALLILLALRAAKPSIADHSASATIPSNAAPESWGARAPTLALVLGFALSYEPLVFVAALAAALPWIAETLAIRWRKKVLVPNGGAAATLHLACAFVLGLFPLALGMALARRPPEIALAVPTFTLAPLAAVPVTLQELTTSEIGVALLVVCLGGSALALLVGSARRLVASLLLVCAIGALAVSLRVPAGPSAFAAPVLAMLACSYIAGATMLAAIVVVIARARVPFAEASAALVVVLELVLPLRALDETSSRRERQLQHAAAVWNDIAWGAAPPASVLIVADRGTMRRVASARVAGAMRGDLLVVPAFDVQGREGAHALLAEPKLAALFRDMALGVAPEELSLAQLGAQRAVLATFDPKWDRALSRHLVPVGLMSRFEPEPRGVSERKKALDAFALDKDRLVNAVKKDADLATATATLLRARAIGMAATGEREMLARTLDDLRAFSPADAVGATLVRRTVTSKGAIDVSDLSP